MFRLPVSMLVAALAFAPLPALAAPPPLPAQAWSDRLAKLDELRRRAAIRGAINDSGSKCGRVTADGVVGPYRNLIMWNARCENPAKDYAFFIGPDGSAQVRGCDKLARFKLPLCKLP